MNKIDVFTFGETMVLFQPEQMLPLEYIHQFSKQIGGAESNVAIGLTRLGHCVGWFSKLGDDPFGRYIQKYVRGEGVDTSSCLYTDKAQTGIFFKEKRSPEETHVYYYRKDSAASLMEARDLNEEYIAQAKILHITGITPALSESCYRAVLEAIAIAKRNKMTIVFDPNLRLKLWTAKRAKAVFKEIASHANVLLPGLDEGQFMTGKTEIEEVADALMGDDDKTIIIKLGRNGAYFQTRDEKAYIKGFPVDKVVDPVGAGDGFAAGIISGLLRKEPLSIVVQRANAIGAIVVGVNGDVEGLPTRLEVERFMVPNANARDVCR